MSHSTTTETEGSGTGFSRRAQVIGAAVVAAALAAALFVFQEITPVAGSTYTTNELVTYQDFGGTVRNTGDGWYVIDDVGHAPDDITIGTATSTSLRFDYPACGEIVSVIVAPDDTYAKEFGLVVGVSAGLSYGVMTGQVNDGPDSGYLPDVWNPKTDYSGSSNIWISGRCIPAK